MLVVEENIDLSDRKDGHRCSVFIQLSFFNDQQNVVFGFTYAP